MRWIYRTHTSEFREQAVRLAARGDEPRCAGARGVKPRCAGARGVNPRCAAALGRAGE